MASYILRAMDDAFWAKVKARAESEGRGLKGAVLHLLHLYAQHGMSQIEAGLASPHTSFERKKK